MTEVREHHSRRTLWLLVTPIVAMTVVGFVASALTPTLLKYHPLLLIALEARNRNLVLTANRVDLVPFVLVATARRTISDPLFFLLGRLYGDRAVRWLERKGGGGAFVRGIERLFRKASYPMVFLFPGSIVCALAGETGMRPGVFAALNVAGTFTAVVAVRAFGDVVSGPVGVIQRFNERNFKWLTLVTVGIVLLWLVGQRLLGEEELQSIDEIERELEGDGETREADEPGGSDAQEGVEADREAGPRAD